MNIMVRLRRTVVTHHTGGLESSRALKIVCVKVTHHTGGLETKVSELETALKVTHHTGGLEK